MTKQKMLIAAIAAAVTLLSTLAYYKWGTGSDDDPNAANTCAQQCEQQTKKICEGACENLTEAP